MSLTGINPPRQAWKFPRLLSPWGSKFSSSQPHPPAEKYWHLGGWVSCRGPGWRHVHAPLLIPYREIPLHRVEPQPPPSGLTGFTALNNPAQITKQSSVAGGQEKCLEKQGALEIRRLTAWPGRHPVWKRNTKVWWSEGGRRPRHPAASLGPEGPAPWGPR